jgi:hypothetical protein
MVGAFYEEVGSKEGNNDDKGGDNTHSSADEDVDYDHEQEEA